MSEKESAILNRLYRIEQAARAYFYRYLQDEAAELECCIDETQHRLAAELKDALTSP